MVKMKVIKYAKYPDNDSHYVHKILTDGKSHYVSLQNYENDKKLYKVERDLALKIIKLFDGLYKVYLNWNDDCQSESKGVYTNNNFYITQEDLGKRSGSYDQFDNFNNR